MRRRIHQRGGVLIPALAACFCIGIMVGWWLRSGAPMPAVSPVPPVVGALLDPTGPKGPALQPKIVATTGEPLVVPTSPASRPVAGAIGDLRSHGLRLPIDDADIDAMEGDFAERRSGHPHEAVDILAPRNTPIHAVEDGAVAKLFESKAGGTTIYQYDPSGRFCYYYAHLERYAPGLREGERVSRGDVIGYVGTSGNAPPNTPHLHFAVFELDGDHHWWKGRAIDRT